ncbi:MAG: ABC transporter ATP-binding protein [Rhizobiaceae bacterium]|nr:ABC transporter ATP-binding protein [Rhizobiaceae bacterium]
MAEVTLENVTVCYPIYGAETGSLRRDIIRAGVGGFLSKKRRNIAQVTALNDITIKLRDGDRLGLVGHNGSGKTTLLKTIAGIYAPDSGQIRIVGRISTVFGLGTGMVPDLSGYENIRRMSMLLGASFEEAEASIPEIEAFTELREFLNVPVRTYSAGMLTRLLFAIATAVHPEVLLIDEVFGAGDMDFQVKAQKRMGELVERASIVVLASHSQDILNRFCTRKIHMEHGRVISQP